MNMEKKNHSDSGDRKTMSRRYFLELIGGSSIVITAVGATILSVEYLSPNVLHEPPLKFKAGSVEDYPAGTVTSLPDEKVYIVRANEGYFYAMSSVCTHLGCITGWNSEEGVIVCPCHGSIFDRQGNVIGGPAPKPLPRFEIALVDQQKLTVDRGVIVGEDVVLKV